MPSQPVIFCRGGAWSLGHNSLRLCRGAVFDPPARIDKRVKSPDSDRIDVGGRV